MTTDEATKLAEAIGKSRPVRATFVHHNSWVLALQGWGDARANVLSVVLREVERPGFSTSDWLSRTRPDVNRH